MIRLFPFRSSRYTLMVGMLLLCVMLRWCVLFVYTGEAELPWVSDRGVRTRGGGTARRGWKRGEDIRHENKTKQIEPEKQSPTSLGTSVVCTSSTSFLFSSCRRTLFAAEPWAAVGTAATVVGATAAAAVASARAPGDVPGMVFTTSHEASAPARRARSCAMTESLSLPAGAGDTDAAAASFCLSGGSATSCWSVGVTTCSWFVDGGCCVAILCSLSAGENTLAPRECSEPRRPSRPHAAMARSPAVFRKDAVPTVASPASIAWVIAWNDDVYW